MKIHAIQHVPFEGPGHIKKWSELKQHQLTCSRIFESDELPSLSDFDLLLVLGGPMSSYDEDKYTWLKAEKDLIERAIKNGKRVLGICLGSQLIADVLGGRVYPNDEKEIGFHKVSSTDDSTGAAPFKSFPDNYTVFQWHGDTFDIPQGAKRIATSNSCKNQGFIYNRKVIALQYHLEATSETIENLILNCSEDMTDGKFVQSKEYISSQYSLLQGCNELMNNILDYLESV